jgi:Uma2 family endonuclease
MAETNTHRALMVYFIEALKAFFAANGRMAYVSGNNFLFWEEGNPRARISPDCYVVFDVTPQPRDSYMAWREGGRLPAVVFEFTSCKTQREDTRKKRPLYERVLCIREYFQFDPTGDYLAPHLQGFRLDEAGNYQPLPLQEDRLHGQQLGLDLVIDGERLRLFDPRSGQFLLTPVEAAARTIEQAARLEAQEAELKALRARLARLKGERP